MKLIYLIIIFFFYSCSFDDKTGIWKNEKNLTEDKKDIIFKDFKKISSTNEIFDKTVALNPKFKFRLSEITNNESWSDIFYDGNNNSKNYQFKNTNQLNLKSKKLSKYSINKYLLFENKNVILSDSKGDIIIYPIEENSPIKKFNFYKKKYKKIDKLLNLTVENNTIFVTDNFGYIYAYDYLLDRIKWAKNYKIPFRSNIKIFNNKILAANQNNDFYVIEKNTGNLIKLIPSETTVINNSFINNISLGKNEIFFLNTYGSIYSIDINNFKLNWFINLNKTLDSSISNLFIGSEVVNFKNRIIVASNQNFYLINSTNGSIIQKTNFTVKSKPIINNDYIFLITKKNLLIAMSLQDGKIIYSYDLNDKVADFTDTKKKNLKIKNIMLVNNNLFVFLVNSYVVNLGVNGEINELIKLPSKINSYPIFVNSTLLFIDIKNRLFIVN